MEEQDQEQQPEPLPRRLHRALGPLAVGILLDVLDLATFGPVGLYLGVVVGLAAGWYLGSMAGLARGARVLFAIGAAIYLTVPMTEFLPIATVVSALGRFRTRAPLDRSGG